MAELTSLAEAVSALVHDGDTVALEGFTHLIPQAAGHELIRQGRRDLTLVRMTPGPRLRPDGRDGLRAEARLLLGRESRRRLAAPDPRRGRERLAGAARARGALARRHGGRVVGRRREPALRRPARLPRRRPAGADARGDRRLPVHRRGARGGAGAAARRRDRPRAAGRPAGQRPALGDQRRAEGGGARLHALARHRRGDRRPARAAAGRRRHPGLGDRRGRASPRSARTPPTRTATTTATTTSTSRGRRSAATATASGSGWSGTCSARPTSASTARASRRAAVA